MLATMIRTLIAMMVMKKMMNEGGGQDDDSDDVDFCHNKVRLVL